MKSDMFLNQGDVNMICDIIHRREGEFAMVDSDKVIGTSEQKKKHLPL